MAKYSGRHMAGARQPERQPQDRYTYVENEQAPGQDFEDLSSYSSARQKHADERELQRQRGPVKKRHMGLKIGIAVLAVLLALMGVAIFYVQGYLLKDLRVNVITKNKEELGIHEELAGVTDTSIKNIALLGLDSRDGAKSGSVRSDAMMIITVDNKHGKIKMTSVLRDSNVSIRQKSEDGGYYYFDDKITHSYAYGGPEMCVQTLNRNFFLNIEDYVTVNFEETAAIVDDLTPGEVMHLNLNLWSLYAEVEAQKDNDGGDLSGYPSITRNDFIENIYGEVDLYNSGEEDYKGGTYTLNGNQAVAYARIRHLDSDDVRASRQQRVLSALLNQIRGKSKLEYPDMISKILPFCTTSLEFDDIVGMIPILLTDFTIETMSVPGEKDNANGGYNSLGGWVYLYDLEQAAREINEFIYETPTQVKVDDDVQRVSNIYRSGSYGNTGTEYTPDEEEDWEPPEDMPIYIPEESEPSETSGGESSEGESSESSETSGGGETSESSESSGEESSEESGEPSQGEESSEESSEAPPESSQEEVSSEAPPADSGGESSTSEEEILF